MLSSVELSKATVNHSEDNVSPNDKHHVLYFGAYWKCMSSFVDKTQEYQVCKKNGRYFLIDNGKQVQPL